MSVSIDAYGGVEERVSTPMSRLDGQKIAKEMKKNGGVGTYKEEIIAVIETKRILAVDCKEEKMTRLMELK